MLESDDIIKYLYDTYGDGKVQKHSIAAFATQDLHIQFALDHIDLACRVGWDMRTLCPR
jgi:hypothetical protein